MSDEERTWRYLKLGLESSALGIAAVLFFFAVAVSALAQTSSPSAGCEVAPSTNPPTPVEKGSDSGSKNMGSTGWSGGGMGGSHTGTSASGPTPGSTTEHPATAKGVDPTKSGEATKSGKEASVPCPRPAG